MLAVLWGWGVIRPWSKFEPPNTIDDVDERTLGAAVIMGQLNAVITGASIIVAGLGAFVALGWDKIGEPENFHLFYSAMWAVVAISISLYTMSTLPSRTLKENFVHSPGVALLCALTLFFSLSAGARFLFAVGTILIFGTITDAGGS